jgi:hypothetical protein
MMRQFDDPDVAVSYAAILIFFGAVRPVLGLLGGITRGTLGGYTILDWLYVAAVAAAIVGAILLLRKRRQGWPLAVGGTIVATLFELLLIAVSPLGGLLGLLFNGLTLFLLTRPSVRERFGVGRR